MGYIIFFLAVIAIIFFVAKRKKRKGKQTYFHNFNYRSYTYGNSDKR